MPTRPLKGSERQPVPGARSVAKADPAERLEVSVLVRRRGGEALEGKVKQLAAGDKAGGHIGREDFERQFGADPADLAAVKKFAGSHGLAVVQEHAARRTVVLSGTVAQFNEAFGVDLQQFEHDGGSYRGRTGSIHLPEELNGIVEAVLGLDNRPQARPHFRSRRPDGNVYWRATSAQSTSFTPTQLASLYDFPGGTGQGECIAIIELGGGYRTADLRAYFSELNIARPQVSAVSVDHGKNHPTGDPNGPDGEVMLDIEVAGAIAPGASIVVYFAPNTDAGFLDAITTAVHDTTHKPSVISISWGGPESSWTQQSMTAFDEAFQAAAAMGITLCVASGDAGSSDGVNDGADHVDFPASSPYALACGGTSLQASSGNITSEAVWNDGANGGAGGGGVSSFFALPSWQATLQVTNAQGVSTPLQSRGVPDVSGDADPLTGYDVRVDGSDTIFGGTSAVAPLWAGLIARINSAKGSAVGYIHPQLYKNAGVFNDITQGNNGDFSASVGWDACTGLGSPDGRKLAGIL
ncbi:MAG TPA: S53 family peptidase [Burkholderiales bacterium]|nr:S53 family peptidase [Burkholderiales bacterium]